MKEIKGVELIEQSVTKYVADDGTEFTSKRDCMDYEYQCALDKLSVIETCSDLDGYSSFDGGECSDCHKYTWYRPKNKYEIELLNTAYQDGIWPRFREEMIGKWICVESDDMEAFTWVTTLSDSIEYAKNVLSKLGYDMVVSKRTEM